MSAPAALVPTRPVQFELPPALEAAAPPESRGVPRDGVRMLVGSRSGGELVHARFADLPGFLEAGDLVIVNTSGTIPAAVDATARYGERLTVHFSALMQANLWVVELRRDAAPYGAGEPGMTLWLPDHGAIELLAPYAGSIGRLWIASVSLPQPPYPYLAAHGRPIRYGYVRESWPIATYQNVYATEPGSAEMPSAGRPFTPEVITSLVVKGVGVVGVLLHTGVSSLGAHERPYPEYYRVSRHTAHAVNDARRQGGRVVAIGTTVVRALETVADTRGRVHAGDGWTDTIVTPARGVRAVDGLLTGWHEPEASHLDLLEAVAGRELVVRSYEAALAGGYLWHEFGDVHLILP